MACRKSRLRPIASKRRDATLHANDVEAYLLKTENLMLQIAIVLLVLWALGLVSGYALGGLIHLLLVIGIIILAIRFFTGRKVV